jgi:hypothetical protein
MGGFIYRTRVVWIGYLHLQVSALLPLRSQQDSALLLQPAKGHRV